MSEMTVLGTPATQMFDVFAPGTMLGRNELLATIGEGGMARVILARQRGPMGFEKVVVVKIIHPDFASDRAAVGMLLDEARVAAQINHPNVVQTYELGIEVNGHPYIVMEYLAGESLQRILKSVSMGVSFDPRVAARIVADTCDGLHAAHELTDLHGNNLGLIHRDVSLGNIVVLYNGCVKVVDFGIVKTRDRVSSTTQHGQLKGKYAYMSPEQIRNEPMDRRSDVFSLGVVLWETLALRRLFHADNVPGILIQILEAQRVAPSAFRPEVPRELDAIALKALEIDPAKRFQSAFEMKRALEDVIWQSRCDAGDVRNYMTAVFGDRMRKRQALLADAARHSASLLEPKDARFDDTSGLRPAPVLPRKLATKPPENKRNWLAGVVLAAGVMIGVGAGVRLIGGSLGRDNTVQAKTIELPKDRPVAPPATATPIAAVPEAPVTLETEETMPTLRSKLRPEHLEPVRVELEVRTEEPPKVTTQDSKSAPEPARVGPKVTDGKAAKLAAAKELYSKGSALFLAGSFVDAVNVYKQALALDRSFAPAHRGLGMAYQRMGFDALAITSFTSYLALAPSAGDSASIQRRIEQLKGQP
jgi:serine/threonine protein kinase